VDIAKQMLEAVRTFVDFHVRECLPFIHCHDPFVTLPPAAEINDQVFGLPVEGFEDFFQVVHGEFAGWKEVRCYYNLLLSFNYALTTNTLPNQPVMVNDKEAKKNTTHLSSAPRHPILRISLIDSTTEL
jgi:hypothetical protein